MKLRAGTARLDKQRGVKLSVRITKIAEELVPLLLGMELLFNVSARQYFENLKLTNREAILEALYLGGYIAGPHENWEMALSLKKQVHQHLLKCPAIAQKARLEQSEVPISLSVLCQEYKRLLMKANTEDWSAFARHLPPKMRQLCKRMDSKFIAKEMAPFFKHQQFGSQDYSLEAFEAYLQQRLHQVLPPSTPLS